MEDPAQIAADLAGSAVGSLDQAAASVESGEQVSLEQAMQAVASQGGDTTIAQHALNALGGFVTGFATSYTDKDYLSPYLQSQVARRKESRARIQIFNKMAMAVNKDPDTEALFVKLLGNPSQEDLPRVLASIDSQTGEMMFDEHLRAQANKGKEEDRLQAAQDMVLTRSAEAQAFGFTMPGPDATREENLEFVSKVDAQRDANNKVPQASAARLSALNNAAKSLRPEHRTDEEWEQDKFALLAPFREANDMDAGVMAVDALDAGRTSARKELLNNQADEILANRVMPSGMGWKDLTEGQQARILPNLTAEYNNMTELASRDNLELISLLTRDLLGIPPEYATTETPLSDLVKTEGGAASAMSVIRNAMAHPSYVQAQQLVDDKERIYQGLGTINAGLSALGIAEVELKHLGLGSLLTKNGDIVLDVNSPTGQKIQQELNALIQVPGRGETDVASLVEFGAKLGFSESSFVGPIAVAEAVRENATAGQPSPNATKQAVTVKPDFATMSANATSAKLTRVEIDLPNPVDLTQAEATRYANLKVKSQTRGALDAVELSDYEELDRRDKAARSPNRAINQGNMRAISGTLMSNQKISENALGRMISPKQNSQGQTSVDTAAFAGALSGTMEDDVLGILGEFVHWSGTQMAATQTTEGSRLDSPTSKYMKATYDGLIVSIEGQAELAYDRIFDRKTEERKQRFADFNRGSTRDFKQTSTKKIVPTGVEILQAMTGQVYTGNTISFNVKDAAGTNVIRTIDINDLDPEELEAVAAMFLMYNNIG